MRICDWSSDVCSSDLNELNLRLFCDLLNAHGYSAHPVRDGRDALKRAREVAPDLIIMDIQPPHVSGLDLIRQMKADPALRPVPIMAVTAYAGKGRSEEHTSELQSLMRISYAVFCLNKKTTTHEK